MQTSQNNRSPKHLAIFVPSLAGGGVVRVMLHLAESFTARDYKVDIVVCQTTGPYLDRIRSPIRVVALKPSPFWLGKLRAVLADPRGLATLLLPILLPYKPPKALQCLPDLVNYLRQDKPDAVLAAKTHTNLVALWARRSAARTTRLVISERTNLSTTVGVSRRWRWRFVAPLLRRVYPWADAIVSVSDGVANDLSRQTGIPRESITTIYNPVLVPRAVEGSKALLDHPWFAPGNPPVVLGVGRLVPQKDFSTLIRAFALLRNQRPCRLLILGEGRERPQLQRLAGELRCQEDVRLSGFVDNPYAYMVRASVFVLSSAWEGMPNALIEALACGCPVVSTDCPSGPREILNDGTFGPLVPVGNVSALADAMFTILAKPPQRERLRARAREFNIDKISERYLQALLTR